MLMRSATSTAKQHLDTTVSATPCHHNLQLYIGIVHIHTQSTHIVIFTALIYIYT